MLPKLEKPEPEPDAGAVNLANPEEPPPEANGFPAGVEEVCDDAVPHGDDLLRPPAAPKAGAEGAPKAGLEVCPNAGCVEPVAAPREGFEVCPNAGVVEPATWPNGLEDPIAEGAPNAGLAGWPKVEAGVVDPKAGFPNVVAGVVDPKGEAPNLGPEGVEGAPKVAADLLNRLLPLPGVGIFEGVVAFGAAAGVSSVEEVLPGVTSPG